MPGVKQEVLLPASFPWSWELLFSLFNYSLRSPPPSPPMNPFLACPRPSFFPLPLVSS